jgi:DNA-directed RNA polymerase subunit M/transcription elongation factor TFIIS
MMKCKKCSARLEVHRMCRRVTMRCTACKHEYQIHEIASELDQETEKILEKYTAIIYD